MSQAVEGKVGYLGSLHGMIEGMPITLPPIVVSPIWKNILMLSDVRYALCHQGIRFAD